MVTVEKIRKLIIGDPLDPLDAKVRHLECNRLFAFSEIGSGGRYRQRDQLLCHSAPQLRMEGLQP
jgi:hypothetical protein